MSSLVLVYPTTSVIVHSSLKAHTYHKDPLARGCKNNTKYTCSHFVSVAANIHYKVYNHKNVRVYGYLIVTMVTLMSSGEKLIFALTHVLATYLIPSHLNDV